MDMFTYLVKTFRGRRIVLPVDVGWSCDAHKLPVISFAKVFKSGRNALLLDFKNVQIDCEYDTYSGRCSSIQAPLRHIKIIQ